MSIAAFSFGVLDGVLENSLGKADYQEQLILGPILSAIAISISRRIQSRDERLLDLSLKDALTGLPNRSLLYERINSRLSLRNPLTPTVVIFADLDNFKEVNNNYGHDVGDAMLKEVAHRLTKVVRNEDTVARLGGDEFVIMCTSISDIAGVEVLCERLSEKLREPFHLDGHEVTGGGSLGCVVFDKGDADAERLVSLADEALRRTKKTNKGGFQISDLRSTPESENEASVGSVGKG